MNTVNEPRKTEAPARLTSPRGALLSNWAAELRILLVALLLAAYFQILNHDFPLSNASLVNLSQFIAPVAIIAFGETMLMIGGDIDLSAGMVFAFVLFMMVFANDAGAPMWLAVIAGLVAAAIIGFVNGAVTVYLRLPSFVTTLGTLFLINGITLTVSRGTPVATPGSPGFAAVMGAWSYSEIIWTLALAYVMHVLLRHTRWGLHTQAAGANALGASEAGIRVNKLRLGNFVLAAGLAGLAGILEGFRITSIDPQAGGISDHVSCGRGGGDRRHAVDGRLGHHRRRFDRRGGARHFERWLYAHRYQRLYVQHHSGCSHSCGDDLQYPYRTHSPQGRQMMAEALSPPPRLVLRCVATTSSSALAQ